MHSLLSFEGCLSLGRSDSRFDFVDRKPLPFFLREKKKKKEITSGSPDFYSGISKEKKQTPQNKHQKRAGKI